MASVFFSAIDFETLEPFCGLSASVLQEILRKLKVGDDMRDGDGSKRRARAE
jgi:hypothetical protein